MSKRNYDLSRLSVMIVDDNKYMQLLLKEILRAFNIRSLQTADDGADALKLMRTFSCDLIICDWNMKPLDGLEFVELVRNSGDSPNPYVPIIMLTGHTEYARVVEARSCGVNEFLAKPVSPANLYQRMISVIEHPRKFVRTNTYFGPDRRRERRNTFYDGPDRRKAEEN